MFKDLQLSGSPLRPQPDTSANYDSQASRIGTPTRASLEVQHEAPKRSAWIDTARGVGILLVVYGHVLRGLEGAGLIVPGSGLSVSDYAIYTFHMPLFFVLAGITVERAYQKGRRRFMENKIMTIVIPYLVWSVVQGSVQLLLPSTVNSPRSLLSLIQILWIPIGQFWFLYSLFIFHLIAWTLGVRREYLLLIGVCSFGLSQALPPNFPHLLTYMFPFYVSGIYFNKPPNWLTGLAPNGRVCLCLMTGYSVGVFLGAVKATNELVYMIATICGILSVICLSKLVETSHARYTVILSFFGRNSMTIYLLHILATAATRVVLLRFGCHALLWQLVIGCVAGVIMPLGLGSVLKTLRLSPLLGLRVNAPLLSQTSGHG